MESGTQAEGLTLGKSQIQARREKSVVQKPIGK